jgi:Aldehyde dehydrogenase family
MSKDVGHWIGGKVVAGTSGRYGDISNPSVGERSGRLTFASAAEVDAAVRAAREALPKWAATTPLRRARIMFRLKDLLEQHMDEIAERSDQRAQHDQRQPQSIRRHALAGEGVTQPLYEAVPGAQPLPRCEQGADDHGHSPPGRS